MDNSKSFSIFLNKMLDNEFQKCLHSFSFNNLDDFEKKVIEKYNISINTLSGFKDFYIFLHRIVLIYFLTDIQLTILKSYLSNITKKKLSKDDLLFKINKLYKYSGKDEYISPKYITELDLKHIINDFIILEKLQKNHFFDFIDTDQLSVIIENAKNGSFNQLLSLKYCSKNCFIIRELKVLGLEEYINKKLPLYLKNPTIEEEIEEKIEGDFSNRFNH